MEGVFWIFFLEVVVWLLRLSVVVCRLLSSWKRIVGHRLLFRKNIKMTKSEKQFQLLKMDAARALTQLTGKFDLVLLDPPYAKEQIVANITQLEEQGLLAEEVMLVCETDKAVDLPEEISNFGIWKQKTYGISKVTVYVR